MHTSSRAPRTLREDVDQFCRVLRRATTFWGRTVVVVAIAFAITGVLAWKTAPVYRSETLILYQEAIRSSDLTGAESGNDNARRVGARLREALLSRASLEPIVTDLHLFERADADRHDVIDAVEETRGHIVFKAREGDTFAIAFDGSSPEEAQEVTQRLADRIVDYAATRRSEHAFRLKEFLDAESSRNQETLKAKEAALTQFLSAHPDLALSAQNEPRPLPRAGATGPSVPTDPELVALEVRASRIEQQLRATEPRGPAVAAPSAAPVDGPEVVGARRDLADKILRFTDRHPDVLQARARLEAAEAAQAHARAVAADETARLAPVAPVAPGDEGDRAMLTTRLDELRARIRARRATHAVEGPGTVSPGTNAAAAEVEFFRLQRELNEMRDRQKQLDDKQFKAAMMATLSADDRNIQVSVLDPAYLPSHPISRSRRMLAVGGLLAGLALAILTALVSARLDDRLHERADVLELELAPVVAVIPRAGPRSTKRTRTGRSAARREEGVSA